MREPASSQEFLLGTGLTLGWRCLEVGAGGGSIGRWLSEIVGVNGRVTVTDIAISRFDPALASCGNVTVRQHDVVTDPPAGLGEVHASTFGEAWRGGSTGIDITLTVTPWLQLRGEGAGEPDEGRFRWAGGGIVHDVSGAP